MRTLYLNQSGHRWINVLPNGKRERINVIINGIKTSRAVLYWQAIGNFAVPTVKIGGKRQLLCETNSSDNCWIQYAEKYPSK
jgi:D-aminopeptidase